MGAATPVPGGRGFKEERTMTQLPGAPPDPGLSTHPNPFKLRFPRPSDGAGNPLKPSQAYLPSRAPQPGLPAPRPRRLPDPDPTPV